MSKALKNKVKLNDYVNVKDLGAVGNGVADDTAAFVAAFAKSSVVYVPKGTYNITDTLNLPDGTTLKGEGKFSTNLIFNLASDKDCIVIGWDCTLSNFRVRSQAPGGGMKGVIRMQSLTNSDIPTNVGGNNWRDPAIGGLSYRNTLEHLTVENGQNYNIYGANLAYTTIDDVRSVLARGTGGNIYIWGKGGVNMPASTSVKFIGGQFTASFGGPGIRLETTTDSIMTGTICEGNFSRGMVLVSCARITMQGCYLENNFALGASTGDGDLVVTGSDQVSFLYGHILGNNSSNAVAASSNTNCALMATNYYVLGGAPHTLNVDAGWTVSSNAASIVESGTQAGGRWVKYSDGTATYSKKVTLSSIAINAAVGSYFVQPTGQSDTDFPAIFMSDGAAGFVFNPSYSIASDSSVFTWVVSSGSSRVNNALRYRLASATSVASATVDVYITMTGRWK